MEIKQENIVEAYNSADENGKRMLIALFGEEAVQATKKSYDRPVTERIKTFNDAIAALDSNHPFVCDFRAFCAQSDDISSDDISPDMLAYLKLRIICAALNEGWEPQFTEDEYRWYTWHWLYTQSEIDYMDDEERKKCHLITTGDYITEFAGFGFADSYSNPAHTFASFGSRLCLKSSELASYCGKQFIGIWADFRLIRK